MPGLPGEEEGLVEVWEEGSEAERRRGGLDWDRLRTGNASRDDDDVSTGERVLHAIVLGEVSGDFLWSSSALRWRAIWIQSFLTEGVEMCDKSAATPGVLTTS